eukprot:s2315_g4.t1
MDSKKVEEVGVDGTSRCEVRAWSTVVLGLANSLLFSGVLWGWASLQSFLEDDGVYQGLCDLSGCDERKERMLYLYSNGQMFSIFAYAILSLLMDRTGPVFLSIVGGLFETFGLILLAYLDITNTNKNNENWQLPFDVLDFAVSMIGIGSSAIMVHALKLAFIVPTAKFAWVMTLTNCIVDGSAVMPAVLYQLYRLGMSRQFIFTMYAGLCFALNAALLVSWFGPNLEKLRSKNAKESSSRDADSADASTPRLHGLSLPEQLRSFEFAFAFVIYLTQGFSATSYLGFNKNLLSMLGDQNNIYAQVFTALLPASILFAPLFGMSLSKKGFAFTFSLMLLLGFIWSIVTLVPSLQTQLVAFLAFTNYRAMLYSAHFTFLAHTFGNRTFGSVNAILSVLAALLSGLIGPSASFSQHQFGSLVGMSLLIICLMVPSSLMTVQLARHLRIYPAGDVCSLHKGNAETSSEDLSQSSESADSEESNCA